ncbi:MAG: hypothetical protein KY396_04760 [Actinobacteria bacterium]|nr:hypothetical protein [Actinomycetota bacterium]
MTTDTTTSGSGSRVALTGARRGALVGLRYLALAFAAVAILVMVPLVGVGVFGMEGPLNEETTSFQLHGLVGLLLWVSTLVMIILAVVARPGAFFIVIPVVLFVLLFLQGPLLGLADASTALAWVHPLNGLICAGLAAYLGLRARARLRGA